MSRRLLSTLSHKTFVDGVVDLPPVILLHGLFGSKNNMRSAALRMGNTCGQFLQRKIVGIDLRNHGSSPHFAGMTYEEQANDLSRVMDVLNIEKGLLVGHSMGGKVAMHMALTLPERVEKLVVVDIAPTRYKRLPHFEYVKYMKICEPLAKKGDRKGVRLELEKQIRNPQIVHFLMTNLVPSAQPGELEWRVNLSAIEWGMPDILGFPASENAVSWKPFEKEVLVLAAEGSGFIETYHHPTIRHFFPKADIRQMGKHHWVHASNLSDFVDAVCTFSNVVE